jgi:8-oxo-dGTP pyrophosphatase MutT (NUDIX family)
MSRHKRSVFVALLKGDEVLTVTEHNGQVGLPGGRAELGESWMTALAREFSEEIAARLPYQQYTHISLGTHYYELRILVAQISDAEAKLIAAQSAAAGQLTDVRSWTWTRRDKLLDLNLRPHIRAGVMILNTVAASPVSRESAWRNLSQPEDEKTIAIKEDDDEVDLDDSADTDESEESDYINNSSDQTSSSESSESKNDLDADRKDSTENSATVHKTENSARTSDM